MEYRQFKETLLEFLSDVTTVAEGNKKVFLEGNKDKFFQAPEGFRVLSDFVLFKEENYTRVKELPQPTPPEGESPSPIKVETEIYHAIISFRIYTATHGYFISAVWKDYHSMYLGCLASTRMSRAGEDWTRGNDLPDGEFNRETWTKIKNSIIKHEMEALSDFVANGHYYKNSIPIVKAIPTLVYKKPKK